MSNDLSFESLMNSLKEAETNKPGPGASDLEIAMAGMRYINVIDQMAFVKKPNITIKRG